MPKNLSIEGRFWQKVDRRGDDECWHWTASRDPDGYGRFQYPTENGQRHIRAHRWAYLMLVGPIGDGLVVCHRCDNPPCVNPAHLFLGTQLDNNADKVAKGRHARVWGVPLLRSRQTHCKHGHELAGDNLVITPTGHRSCRACRNAIARISYRKKKGLPGSGQARVRTGVI